MTPDPTITRRSAVPRLRRARSLAPWLVAVAYLLLVAAWVGANPPGAAPDEPAHYVKALGAGGGDVLGAPLPGESRSPEQRRWGATSLQMAWQQRTSRVFEVPPSLAPPPSLSCNAFLTEVSSQCRDQGERVPPPSAQASYIGTYQPFLYLAPGSAARLADDPSAGMLLARAAGALLVVSLLALAGAVLWDRAAGSVSLFGLLLAVTPMVVFLASAVSASGAEVAAGVCYLAAVLRLARPRPPTTRAWTALALGGTVLSLSRPLGPVWVVLGVAVLAVVAGVRRSRAIARAGGVRAAAAAAIIAVGVVSSLAWELTQQIHPGADITMVVEGIVPSLRELPEMYRQHVGVFGWLDTQMPLEGYVVWTLGLVLLLVLAIVLGTARQRAVLAVLVVATGVICVAGSAALIRPTGFGMQARYVLPLAVVVPLFAGEVLRSHWWRLPSSMARGLLWSAAGFVTAVQLLAWYANARRHAVGTAGPWLFLGVSEWQPPLGWLPWMILAVAGSGLVLIAVAVSSSSEPALPALDDAKAR